MGVPTAILSLKLTLVIVPQRLPALAGSAHVHETVDLAIGMRPQV
jgi:hypothetical protein